MSYAVIDIGTNTLILLIAQIKKGKMEVLCDRSVITRLGQQIDDNHFFLSEAMKRTTVALLDFKKTCDEFNVNKIAAVGTYACRTAANTGVLVDRVKKECGFKIEVLTGEQEAELTFLAAWKDFEKKKKLIVVDIGGGSTEIITGPLARKKKGPETVISLSFGSVRLTEQYVRYDPVQEEEFKRLHLVVRNGIRDELDDFYPKSFHPKDYTLVATAGTATTLAAIDQKMAKYNPKKIHGSKLDKKKLENMIHLLARLSIKQRQELPGMEALRADVILAGGLLLLETMAYFEKTEALISDRGLRYGVFYKKFMK